MSLTYQDRYEAYVDDIAPKYEIRTELIEAIIEKESNWDDEAINRTGKNFGLMQINPDYQIERMKALNVEDIREPYSNILVGCDYLSELIERYGNETEALMVFNMGWRGQQLFEEGTISAYASSILSRAEQIREDKENE